MLLNLAATNDLRHIMRMMKVLFDSCGTHLAAATAGSYDAMFASEHRLDRAGSITKYVANADANPRP